MKKTTFLLAGLFGAGFSFGQIFSDNFDAVPINTYIGPTSTYWSTWSGTEGGNEDAKTTNNQANSQRPAPQPRASYADIITSNIHNNSR